MKKILVSLLASMMVLMSMVPAFAEKYDADTPIVEATGTTTTFDKYLVMDKDAQVPYADFLFEVTSDGATGTPASPAANEEIYPKVLIAPTTDTPSDATPVVWKGVRPDKVVVTPEAVEDPAVADNIGELVFKPTDTTTDGPYRTGKADIATTNEKYVKKQITLSFANIKFAEPGVYRYYVQEKNGTTYSDLGITYDVNANNSTWRTLDVYVLDDGNGNLEISDYVWYETKVNTAPDHTADATKENAWGVEWTDASDTNKRYVYISNDTLQVQITEDGGTTWEGNGETLSEPPAGATGSVTIDGTEYTTWATAKAAMENYKDKELTPNGAEVAGAEKSSEFVNDYGTQDLEFGKKVEGNQGSRDQWFKFKVKLENVKLEKGTKFEVNVGAYTTENPANAADFFDPTKNAATSYAADVMKDANTKKAYGDDTGDLKDVTQVFTAAKNILTPAATADNRNYLIVETKGGVEWEMYLQHGQYIQIKGIPNGVTYTVTETDSATGYTKIDGTDAPEGVVDGEKELSNAHKDPLTGTIGNKLTKTYVLDNEEGDLYKDGSEYKQLYKNPVDGKYYKTKNGDTYSDVYTGKRYAQDENVYTGVTNKRSGVIPTGLIMGISGGLGIVALAIVALVLVNRRREEEEEFEA